MPSAADVPNRADLVVDGNAYVLDRRADVRAELGYTPTFLPRTNVGAGYGDDQQAFWLTAAQRDWSLGEDQRFFRQGNDVSVSRYWSGTAIDVATAGEVTMKRAITTLSASEAINAACPSTAFLGPGIMAGGTTKLWQVAGPAITDLGLHGLGTTPNVMCAGTRAVYISGEGAGTVGVRIYDGVYATFSATAATRLCYLNNTLYGFRTTGNYDLISYSTAGAVTSIFSWKDANGTVMAPGSCVKLVAHGSKLMIVFSDGSIWQYDGTGTTRVADLGKDFTPHDACSTRGILYISGVYDSTNEHRSGILQSDGDTIETTWRSPVTTVTITGAVNLTTYLEGLAFVDLSTGTIRRYNVGTGAISTLGSISSAAGVLALISDGTYLAACESSSPVFSYPAASAVATTATVRGSLIDFESSLTKLFRGVIVEWEPAPTGDGGSVDIAYQVGGLDGSYTSLQTGAVSGTEYTLSSVTGRNISIKVTLNKGTSSAGPKLKRVYVRAVPLQQQYRRGSYRIDCSGRDGRSHVQFNDGTQSVKDGQQMLVDLTTSATSTTPISITDALGTYTGVIELDSFAASEFRPQEYIVEFRARQV